MELGLSDILKLVRRWWWVLVLCPVVAVVVAYTVSSAMDPTYEAKVKLLVDQGQIAGGTNYDEILASERRAKTYSQMIVARPVLVETIQRLGLSMTPDELAARVSVVPIEDTQLLSIAVSDTSAEQAARIANTMGQVFIDQVAAEREQTAGTSRDELQQSIESVKQQIDDATARITGLQSSANATAPETQSEVLSLQGLLSQYQQTYSGLLEVQQRMDLAMLESSTQIRVAEQATPPSTPVSPRTMLNTGIGGFLGLVVAIVMMLVAGYLDDTAKDSEDVQRLTGRPALGLIPKLPRPLELEPLRDPRSRATEAYRSLRTNLLFATAGTFIGSLVVTSARPSEGKTTTLVNLGVVLAQAGQRVILVDGDLRRPQLHKRFAGITNRFGLTNLLLGSEQAGVPQLRPLGAVARDRQQFAENLDYDTEIDVAPYLQETAVPGLSVLTTGPLPPYVIDVLNMPRLRTVLERLKQEADVVLVDAPPLDLSDPMIMAGMVDATLLVITAGKTRSKELVTAVQQLSRTETPVVGIVVNQVAAGPGSDYYYHYEETAQDASPERFTSSRLPNVRTEASRPAVAANERVITVQGNGHIPGSTVGGPTLDAAHGSDDPGRNG